MCKVCAIWLTGVIWWVGILFYAEPFVWIAVAAILAAALVTRVGAWLRVRIKKTPAEEAKSQNLSAAAVEDEAVTGREDGGVWQAIDHTKKVLLAGSFGALLFLALEQLFFHQTIRIPYVYGGWSPEFVSRGMSSRLLDRFAMVFGYTLLIGLFVSVIYGQQWCRDLTRFLRSLNQSAKDEEGESQADRRVHSLVFLGEATAVTVSYTPWLLAFMLAMILAYHPLVSPVPVSRGLLVMLSLSIAVLVASTIYLRAVIQPFRKDVLYDLRGELFELQRSARAESGSSPSSSPSSSSADAAAQPGRKKTAKKAKKKTAKKKKRGNNS